MTAVRFDQPTDRPRRAPLRNAIGRSLGKWIAIGLVAMLAISMVPRFLARFNPFAERTVDRTGPALLTAITDMHTYQAASGQFQVVVDLEKDAKWMPSALRGERVVVMADGNVDAGVDFAMIGKNDIIEDPVSKSITITLPHATLGTADVNLQTTKVVEHKRGLLDRLGNTFGDESVADDEALKLAEMKLAAAAANSDLLSRAEANTAAMVKQLASGLGHPNVTVKFADPIDWETSTAGPKTTNPDL
jgi:hypothetical protein